MEMFFRYMQKYLESLCILGLATLLCAKAAGTRAFIVILGWPHESLPSWKAEKLISPFSCKRKNSPVPNLCQEVWVWVWLTSQRLPLTYAGNSPVWDTNPNHCPVLSHRLLGITNEHTASERDLWLRLQSRVALTGSVSTITNIMASTFTLVISLQLVIHFCSLKGERETSTREAYN